MSTYIICQPLPNTWNALPRKVIQVERRCPRPWRPRIWRPRLWQDVGASNRLQRCEFKLFFRFFASTDRYAAPYGAVRCRALQCGAVLRSAVRSRALPCGAALCRAVPRCAVLCCAFSFVHTRRRRYHACGVGESQHIVEHLYSSSFSFFDGGGGVSRPP